MKDATTASTYHGPEITIEGVRRAMMEIQRLTAPPTEIRLHPEDLRALRLRAGEHVFVRDGEVYCTSSSLLGLPVVEDPDAPRLPRWGGF